MTDDNTPDQTGQVDMENLDTFEKEFFQKEEAKETRPAPEENEDEVVENSDETEDDSLATEKDTDAPSGDEDQEADGEDEETLEEDPSEDQPKPKGKKTYQQRINELTAKAREAERREADVLLRLREMEARSTEVKRDPEPTPIRENLPADAPNPDALNDKDEPIYKLGEFDPAFIRDLTKFTIAQETANFRTQEAEQTRQREIADAQTALTTSWVERVQSAEEDIPEIRENIASLANTFVGIEPAYGDYLASTLMESERGPEIMNYLSQNIGEAQQIVAAGPRAATLAIGRLEARFAKAESTDKRDDKLVSHAPPPPTSGARGRGARTAVRGDTDDLEAFEKIFFKD